MIDLVRKSASKSNENDEEYRNMKQRILTIIHQSSQDDIFYEQRLNVRSTEYKRERIIGLFQFIVDMRYYSGNIR